MIAARSTGGHRLVVKVLQNYGTCNDLSRELKNSALQTGFAIGFGCIKGLLGSPIMTSSVVDAECAINQQHLSLRNFCQK